MNETGDVTDADVILTTRQAAKLCRVTEERMRTLAGDGRVASAFRKHQYWFSQVELQRMLQECPEVFWRRRTPDVLATVAQQASRRATMLRLNARQDPHEAAMRGFSGLLAKFAREVDPQNIMAQDERDRAVRLMYRAHMEDVRAKKTAGRRLTSRDERIAALTAATAETTAPAPTPAKNTRQAQKTQAAPESLAICYDCWRENFGGRPPRQLPNKPCADHQRELDAFAAHLRAAS